MRIPERNYTPRRPTDFAVAGARIVTRRFVTSSAAATVVTAETYTVPVDSVLILAAMSLLLSPGAGQIAQRGFAELFPDGVTTGAAYAFHRIPEIQNAIANVVVQGWWTGELWIPPGEVLRAQGVFDAGVAANNVSFHFSGLLVPRANVQEA